MPESIEEILELLRRASDEALEHVTRASMSVRAMLQEDDLDQVSYVGDCCQGQQKTVSYLGKACGVQVGLNLCPTFIATATRSYITLNHRLL